MEVNDKTKGDKLPEDDTPKREEQKAPEEDSRDPCDIIDEASDESFPASDPPSWTAAAL
jgi:hypothetical protein